MTGKGVRVSASVRRKRRKTGRTSSTRDEWLDVDRINRKVLLVY